MPRYTESDDRYRTAHRVVREQREESYKQREKNVRDAATTLDKGSRKRIADLVGDPFADK